MSEEIAEGKIGVSIDGSGIAGDVAQIVNSIDDITRAANQAGPQASRGLEKIGDGADRAASNVDRATRNITSSIERTIATIKAGGRGTSGFFESLAATRGADLNALKPYIEQLKQVEQEAEKAALANNNLGISAKQTAFALRNVPAQISDIIVSLQGGQRPLTVFLQQGAQLKDLFGGTGNAVRQLTGFILSSITPLNLAIVAATALGSSYALGSEQADRLTTAIITNGNVSGKTTGSLLQMGREVGQLTNNYSTAREAVELLARSGQLSGDILKSSLTGIVAGAELTGRAVKEVAEDFEGIGKEPTKAIIKLNDQYNFLTVDIYKQITALEKQGKTQEAATLAAKAYADVLSDRKQEVVDNLGLFERAWQGIKNAADAAKNSFLGIGRPLDDLERLAQAQAKLNALRNASNFNGGGAFYAGQIQEQERVVADLQRQQSTAQFLAQEVGKFRQSQKEQINQQGIFEAYVSDNSRLDKAGLLSKQLEDENTKFKEATRGFKQNSAEYLQALASYNQAVKNITEQANRADNKKQESVAERLAKSYADASEKARDFIATQELQRAQSEPLTAAQKLQADLLDVIADKKIKLGGVEEAGLRQLIDRVAAQDSLNQAYQEEVKFYADFEAAYEKQIAAQKEQVKSITEQASQLELQNQLYGKLPSALTEVTIARLRDKKVIAESLGLAVQDIEDQIEALERLRKAQTNNEFLDAEKKRSDERIREEKRANDEIERERKRSQEEINRVVTDSLMRGFEANKSIVENFKDTLKNTFNTLVLRPIISFIVDASGIQDVLGGIGDIFKGGDGGILSKLGDIGSLFNGNLLENFTSGKGLLDVFTKGNNMVVGAIENLGVFLQDGFGSFGRTVAGFLGENAGAISNALPYAGAIVQALQGDLKGAAFTAVGTLIGGPIGGIIGGVVGSLFGKKKPKLVGSQASGVFENGEYTGTTGQFGKRDIGAQSGLASLNETFSRNLGALFKQFDINSIIRTSSAFRTRTNARGYFDANIDGVALSSQVKGKSKRANEVYQSLINTVLGPVLVQAIQTSQLSASIKSLFNGFSNKDEVAAQINATIALSRAQEALQNSYGLTVDRAADAAVATELTGKALTEYVNKLAASSFTLGDALSLQREDIFEQTGIIPQSLKDFDAFIKGLDKSTADGLDKFNELFAIREQVDAFTKNITGLKTGINDALLGVVNPAEQRKLLEANLSSVFEQANIELPTSINDLITLGKTLFADIDAGTATAEALNLAAAFPNLISAFVQTKEIIEDITDTTNRSKDSFKSLADYEFYQSVSRNYGGELASNFVANLEAGRIVNDASGKAVIAADAIQPMLETLQQLKELGLEQKELGLQQLVANLKTASYLAKNDEIGSPPVRVEV